MRAFFLAIMVLVVLAFAFTTLPSDFMRLLANRQKAKSLITLLQNKIPLAKNPVETRAELIDKIEEAAMELERELERVSHPYRTVTSSSALNAKGKTPQELIEKVEDMLEELRTHNTDQGIISDVAEKIIASILSAKNSCKEERPPE